LGACTTQECYRFLIMVSSYKAWQPFVAKAMRLDQKVFQGFCVCITKISDYSLKASVYSGNQSERKWG
jgi:hypothetical protein